MNKTFYVYELWNPIRNEIFYVGKSNTNARRLKEHLCEARRVLANNTQRTRKINIINKILKAGLKPEFKIVFSTLNEYEAFSKEKELINSYGRLDLKTGILTNHTDGGDGASGTKHTDEWKRNMSANSPNRFMQ